MKFADKLFFATTVLLTCFFMIFGIWILSSNFSQLLEREIERGNSENRMFAVLFEMGYQSTREYGEEYAISSTIENIRGSVEQNEDSHIFIVGENGSYYAGETFISAAGVEQETSTLTETMQDASQNYAYCIRNTGENYYMFTVTGLTVGERYLYLGICRDMTKAYLSRQYLVRQYRIALLALVLLGSFSIYLLSRYMTRPIRSLDKLAKRISEGELQLRSQNKSSDEIGELARSFNLMADKLTQQIEAKRLEAKQKEDFTAAFAHELKTPLTSIIGYADMMNSMKLSEEERAEAVFYIYSQGKRLESLSHKLLELVSMDKNPIEMKKLQAKLLEENLRTTMRPIWDERGIRGKIEMEKGILYGDMELLLSLFYNLLDNSTKAMDKGERGFILLKGTALSNGAYEVKVVDNGRGIPKEEVGRITEAFYMVDKSRSRKEGGAGIGMSLCYKIINLHGATLQIDSKLGEGTVMKVIFSPKEVIEKHEQG